MVKRRNKDSRKSFGSKRFNEDFPGARKINASTAYGTCSEQLSPFGGLLGLVKFLDLFDRSFGDNQAKSPQSLDLRGISGLYVVRPHRRPQRIRTPIGLQPGSYRAPQGVVQAFGNPFS